MDCEKVFDAIEHLRRILDWYNPLRDSNSPAMAEAENYIDIIRQNGPLGAPCEARLISLSSWLRILFCKPKETTFIRPADPLDHDAWRRMKQVKRNVTKDLDDIDTLTRSSLIRQTAY